jgi:hypothetical protein
MKALCPLDTEGSPERHQRHGMEHLAGAAAQAAPIRTARSPCRSAGIAAGLQCLVKHDRTSALELAGTNFDVVRTEPPESVSETKRRPWLSTSYRSLSGPAHGLSR